jgi:hypothetical protein
MAEIDGLKLELEALSTHLETLAEEKPTEDAPKDA